MKFRSKSVEIEATQWFQPGDHPSVLRDNLDTEISYHVLGAQGWSTVHSGDWIIQEPRGDGFYPCNPEVFATKYEPIT